MSSTTVSMDFVKSRLLDEELKIKAKFESNGGHSEMSFTASPYTCYKCGKRGHKIADCRQSTTRGNFRGRTGYNRGFHRSNRGQGSTQNNNQGQSSIQANKADEIAFIALCSSTGSNRDINKFILDSGCTQHMVMDELEKCMSEISELKSEVKIGTAKDNEILYARKQGIIRGICQGKEIKIQALIVKETNLPRELWGEAILCSAYELNRSPTEANGGETPAQRWYKKNDLSKLRVFGSQAWAVILPRQTYCLISSSKSDPLTYEDAVKDKEWKEAIEKELNSHTKLNTWTEAELPEGKTAIQTRWVFRTKEDGTKKARVVAKGFQLKEENSFESVYSPAARLSTIRLLLSVALEKDYNIRQLDIPTAFLNGTLESEREVCKFFKFPKDPQLKKKWILLVRSDIEPGPGAFLCSCHFIDGKRENGPQLFEHNRKKRFNFSTPEKRKRSATNQKDGVSTASATQETWNGLMINSQPSTVKSMSYF
ncbi:hypothetical protein JTB14_000614 [Gonioctena quinquepunctata]|nr:hypothetical protein JTB14_000614 [Gonioctena quinquepunctata]